jgi:hypothetical protein
MNRLEWILGIVLVVLLVVVVIFSLLLWFRPDPVAEFSGTPNSATVVAVRANQIAPTSVFEGQTAKIAFAAAQQQAIGWQADAALLNASATWPQGATPNDVLTGETTWSFTFYSLQSQRTALISVINNEANLLSSSEQELETLPLGANAWQLDSQEVIQQFLGQGGAEFMTSNGVTTLTMMLSTGNENGRIEWLVSLFGDQTLNSLTMRIDATTGEILENDADNGTS